MSIKRPGDGTSTSHFTQSAMKLLILTCLVAAAVGSRLSGYQLPSPGQGSTTFNTGNIHGPSSQHTFGNGFVTTGETTSVGGIGGFLTGSQGISSNTGFATFGGTNSVGGIGGLLTGGQGITSNIGSSGVTATGACPGDDVRGMDGNCITPIVRRNFFVYRTPQVKPIVGPRPDTLPPRVEHNVVFIHTPEGGIFDNDPVVVPPPQQKNVIYVLNKRPQIDPSVLEFPPPEQVAPEIFFVNYADGENPQLPNGIDLESALQQASESRGEVIGHEDAIVPSGDVSGGINLGITGNVGTVTGLGDGGQSIPSPLYRTP